MSRFPSGLLQRGFPSRSRERVFPPTGPSWRLAYQANYRAAQSTTSFIGQSTVTLDGIVWTVHNDGNAGTFALTANSGIEIQPDRDTQFDFAAATAPYIEATLADFVPDLGPADRLFVQIRTEPAGLDEDDQGYGIDIGAGTAAITRSTAVRAYYTSSANQVRSSQIWNGLENTFDVAASEPRGLGLGWRVMFGYARYSDSTGWPRPGAMEVASYAFPAGNHGPTTSQGWWGTSSNVVRLFAHRPDTASSDFTAVVKGLRVWRQVF